jgi:VanZ family protein
MLSCRKKHSKKTLMLLALVLVILLLQIIPLPSHTQLWREIQNAGHIPAFGFLALTLLGLSRWLFFEGASEGYWHYLVAFVCTVLIGAVMELAQLHAHREADLYDVGRDAIGAATFLGLHAALNHKTAASWKRKWPNARRAVLVASIVALVLAYSPLLLWIGAYIHRNQAFPQICTFETYWERKFLFAQDADLVIAEAPQGARNVTSHNVGRLTMRPADFPGLLIREPYPDWSDYRYLSFGVYSEMAKPITLVLRVNDIHHNDVHEDRFNYPFTVVPGMNQFRVSLEEIRKAPADREMDMARINTIVLFAAYPDETYTVSIDNIRLE